MDRETQEKCNLPISHGFTRLIVATNIVESGVTIPNVQFVVDYGSEKQMVHKPPHEISIMDIGNSNCE